MGGTGLTWRNYRCIAYRGVISCVAVTRRFRRFGSALGPRKPATVTHADALPGRDLGFDKTKDRPKFTFTLSKILGNKPTPEPD